MGGLRFSLIVTIITLFCISGCAKKEIPTKISWFDDFERGQETAARLGQNMVVDFYTDWCKWCKVLDDSVYTDPKVIQMSTEMVFVKVDADKDTVNASKYGVSGFPTVVLMKPDGEEIDRIYGYLPLPDFINQINLYLQGKETLQDYLGRLEATPNDIEVNYTLAEKYESRSQYEKSASFYSKVLELDPQNKAGRSDKALMNLGFSYYRQKEFQNAIDANTKFLKIYPDSELKEDVIVYIPYFYAKWGKKDKALELYNQYLRTYPEGENVEWVTRQIKELTEKEKL
jgi:thiol-disulfide isomerase/thioredoxin